ncbi:hypothetical protein DPMN_107728 [Dreissena polymorpha]|uniref:Uncharacterized protein n=1 Tax=Dreissena polymorpha TaxID=45954 RepID=A0A9D4QKG3_DREPO|nr:hypothetical protein DPMN_107728 [Dreissena polymorpha]
MDSDKKANIVTVTIPLGWTGSYLVFTILIFPPYLMLFQCVLHVSWWMILRVLTVQKAFNIERQFRARQLNKIPGKIA